MQRTVFFISDGTAITTQTLGHSLLTQFPDIDFKLLTLPFITDSKQAREAVTVIDRASEEDGAAAIMFLSIVDDDVREALLSSKGVALDLFGTFLGPLEQTLGVKRQSTVGSAHALVDTQRYEDRMEATNYALSHDDGISLSYDSADLILVGVSRSGKTPTCLYMALHFGVKAGNYPLTEAELENQRLPPFLRKHRDKVIGLMIDPDRLSRETRKPGSRYASMKQCHREVDAAESLLRMEGVPIFHTTHSSVEEIASRVLLQLGLQREMF
jgi:regulator of PEP synthase PpsR (kinase-PPPase family)